MAVGNEVYGVVYVVEVNEGHSSVNFYLLFVDSFTHSLLAFLSLTLRYPLDFPSWTATLPDAHNATFSHVLANQSRLS